MRISHISLRVTISKCSFLNQTLTQSTLDVSEVVILTGLFLISRPAAAVVATRALAWVTAVVVTGALSRVTALC